jgi:hypothetical protein
MTRLQVLPSRERQSQERQSQARQWQARQWQERQSEWDRRLSKPYWQPQGKPLKRTVAFSFVSSPQILISRNFEFG